MYIFSSVILVVFAVFGAVAFVREISIRMFTRKNDSSVIVITPLDKDEEPEYVLRGALSRLRWGGKSGDVSVCLNLPLDSRTKKICRSVCEEYGFKGLVSRSEAIEIMGGK
jgi:hypothetical protein